MTQLGQAEPATSFTQEHNTVDLDEPILPKLIVGGMFVGMLYFAVTGLQRPHAAGPDALDELFNESRRVQQRVAFRRSHSR